ncbi:MAG TPA: hypothetical protein VN180_04505 [Acidimicrobiia bacterium]|jgi:hypothetical protein|nr:hypothetical protein [Acidimicrobiia bacterium]
MTIPPGEPTIPAGERTVPAGERTVAAGSGGTGGVPPGGPSGAPPDDRGSILLLTGSVLAGLVVGAVLALAVGSGSSPTTPTTTTSSTTTTTTTPPTSTTTTSTLPVAVPQITGFSVSPSAPTCLSNGQVLVSWSTLHTAVVTITLDGANVGTFGGSGSRSVPFTCPPRAHNYGIIAQGANGQQATRSVQVNAGASPPTSTSSTTPTT